MRRISDHHRNKAPFIIALICITILFLIIVWYLFVYNKHATNIPPQTPEQQRAIDSQNGKSTNTSTSVGNPKDQITPENNTASQLDSSVTPVIPEGTFISNHRPNLSGSPAPSSETSICHTTPGATCVVIFTNGSASKSLPTQITDRNGNASWNWNIKDIGLTVGEWTITAKAINGTKSTIAEDPIKLTIGE